MASFFRYWLPPILWAALISLFSTDRFTSEQTSAILLPLLRWLFPQATQATLESLHALTRKLGHWAEFFVLSLLIYRAIRQERIPPWQWRWAFWTLSLVLVYAVADEFHQVFVPGRTASVRDSFLDFVGGSCAVAVLYVRYRLTFSRSPAEARISEDR
jgi:VanZ family protein